MPEQRLWKVRVFLLSELRLSKDCRFGQSDRSAMRELTANEIEEYENLVANSKQMSLMDCFWNWGGGGIEHGNCNQSKEEKENIHIQRHR